MTVLGSLGVIYAQLSLLAVGGIAPTLPEMQRQVVQVHGWMDRPTFAALFALAQAAPGPNMMVSTLVGLHVAGLAGALVATGALIGPSSVLTYMVAGLWHRFRERPWRQVIQTGLVPVTVGLVAASAALLAMSTTTSILTGFITLVSAVLLVLTRLHPLALLAAGAVLGALFG